MYQPAHFSPTDTGAVRALVRTHPLATLVWTDANGALAADPVPMLLDDDGGAHGTLRAHVARANPLWQGAAGRPVLVVFHGPQAYVSPGFYPGKAQDPRVVPTWNYALVQAHGTLRVHDDAQWVHALVSRLTDRQEAPRPAPWRVDDAPDDYLQRMRAAIVGIEIPIDRLDAKFKLSQNRATPDRQGVHDALAASGSAQDSATAALMRSLGPD